MFDHESLGLMLQALAICLVLTGIHGYLGIHVLERKVIFVDLAMAQIAALGATYALFLGYDAHEQPLAVYFFSLAFTLTGAAVFSLSRMRHEKVPQEAFIGIIYASASAVAILILAKSTSAGEHIKGMLVGDILRARWPDIARTAAIYAAIGVFHWVYRAKFFKISLNAAAAEAEGINVRLWDFLFYATFGVVITSSVAIAGVLLVFSFLVVPACIGVLFAEAPPRRILVAWGAGTAVSILGIGFTFVEGNLPAGPVVVAAFAAALIVSALVRHVLRAPRKSDAVLHILAGAAVLAGLGVGSYFLRHRAGPEEHHHDSEFQVLQEELRSSDEARQLHAVDHFRSEPDPHALQDLLALLERTASPRILEHLAATLKRYPDLRVPEALRRAAARPGLDAPLRYEIAESILDLKDPAGLGLLIDVFADPAAPRLARVKALRLFHRLSGKSYGYEIDGEASRLEEIRRWWNEHGSHVKWRENTRRFE